MVAISQQYGFHQSTPIFYINNWGTRFDDCAFRISVMVGLIVEMLFLLFSVYNTVMG